MKRRIYRGICGVSTAVLTLFFALAYVLIREDIQKDEEILAWLLGAWGLMLAAVFSLAGKISQRILRPLKAMDPEKLSGIQDIPELQPLLDRLDWQDRFINRQIAELRKKQDEFKSITDNMSEGFLVIGHDREVLSYNAAVLRFLGVSPDKLAESLKPEGRLYDACSEALKGHQNEQGIALRGSFYRVLANPVYHQGEMTGAVLVILDVTEKEKRESLRREFTANVSHELKTPLTTIYGTAEMLCGNMIRPEDTPRFLRVIYDESGRLIHLVEDILRLSRLDENQASGEKQEVDLYECACMIARRLESAAAQRGIEIQVQGSSTFVVAVPTLLDEMIFNLCDNAVKYNRENGKVWIQINEGQGFQTIRVKDTGIGIPYEHQNRVFERFYRVDKSHSRAVGGTGLGLSIVRHGAAFHGAHLSMNSVPDVGTEVILTFTDSAAQEDGAQTRR